MQFYSLFIKETDENYFFVNALSFVISRTDDTFPLKHFQNLRKNNFTFVKNISVIQNMSVSWRSGSLMKMEIKICFQIRSENKEKYFKMREKKSKVLSQLIVVHQIQISWRRCQKVGKG